MSTAEWGILLGVVGTVTGTAGLFWRVFEWWDQRIARLSVTGSAGRLGQQGLQPMVLYGARFGQPDLVTVTAVCKGRNLTVTKAGFRHRVTGTRYHIAPLFGQLPAKLERGESVTVAGNASALIEAVDTIRHLEVYCEDAEGRTHTGKTDGHFNCLADLQLEESGK